MTSTSRYEPPSVALTVHVELGVHVVERSVKPPLGLHTVAEGRLGLLLGRPEDEAVGEDLGLRELRADQPVPGVALTRARCAPATEIGAGTAKASTT